MIDWSAYCISPGDFPVKYKDAYQGYKLLVVGGGWCVWRDLAKVDWGQYHIMTVNDIYMHFPGDIHHMYSNNHEEMHNWIAARVDRYRNTYTRTTIRHSNRYGDHVVLWPWTGHGTSSLGAIFTGLALGYDEILLAGIPLDNGGHYYDPRPDEGWGNRRFSNFEVEIPDKEGKMKYWEDAKKRVFDNRVKSLSGRTRELLGGP